MDEINVEKIMEEIRSSIPEGEASWEKVRFEDIRGETAASGWEGEESGAEDLERGYAECRDSWRVDFFRPIPGGRFKVFCKRVVRKLIRFCVEPITQCVSEFNKSVVRTLGALRRALGEQRREQTRRERELEALREEVALLTTRVEELEKDKR